MRHLLAKEGLSDRVEVDSAGTAAYHSGEAPDRRARAAAKKREIELGGVARQFKRADWDRFDYVLAMDLENFEDLESSAPSPAHSKKLYLLRSFDRASPKNAGVPDPYYGGVDGFDEVLDQCDAACRGLIAHLRREHGL